MHPNESKLNILNYVVSLIHIEHVSDRYLTGTELSMVSLCRAAPDMY
jgi:hypothetical protein